MTQGFASERGFTRAPSGGGTGVSVQTFASNGSSAPLDTSGGGNQFFLFVSSDSNNCYVELPDAASASGYTLTAHYIASGNRMYLECSTPAQFVATANADRLDMDTDAGGSGHSATIACDGNYWYLVGVW